MKQTRKTRYVTHYGTRDYYKYYKSRYVKKFPDTHDVPYKLYAKIIGDFNKLLCQALIENNFYDFTFAGFLGVIGIRKYKPKIDILENGEVKNRLPINYKETNKLWEKNPEAKAKRVYVRYTNKHTNGYVFDIKWFQSKAKFKNKWAYTMIFKRDFKRALSKRAQLGLLDASLL